jgi:hypothetical protein
MPTENESPCFARRKHQLSTYFTTKLLITGISIDCCLAVGETAH